MEGAAGSPALGPVLLLVQSSQVRDDDMEEATRLQRVVACIANCRDKMKSLEDSASLLDDEVMHALKVSLLDNEGKHVLKVSLLSTMR